MSTPYIPVDKAELLSVVLEAILYGFSLLVFGGTIWTLVSQRSTDRVNRKMFAVACALLLFSTVHLVIDVIRIIEGFISYRHTFPGGSIGYFSDPSQWTFVYKNLVFSVQTLIGDGVVLYRCYMVWQSKLVMILPVLLWCAVGVTAAGSLCTISRATQSNVFGWSISQWITSFYASTFTTNLLATLLLAYRIWHVNRKTTGLHDPQSSQLRSMLHIIIDAGMIYSFTLLAEFICFSSQSNSQYVILDMITPVISITFYMVIIRVGLAHWATQSMNTSLSIWSSTGNNHGVDRRSRMQVHITRTRSTTVDAIHLEN